jgi:hypothetical protein
MNRERSCHSPVIPFERLHAVAWIESESSGRLAPRQQTRTASNDSNQETLMTQRIRALIR